MLLRLRSELLRRLSRRRELLIRLSKWLLLHSTWLVRRFGFQLHLLILLKSLPNPRAIRVILLFRGFLIVPILAQVSQECLVLVLVGQKLLIIHRRDKILVNLFHFLGKLTFNLL